jgi:hypothetical protein
LSIAEVAAPGTGGSRPASELKATLAERLDKARRHTLRLIEPLTDDQLNRVYNPILSPLIWDLGHIANFEELWLVQRIGGRDPLRGDLGELYDAIEQPARSAESSRSSAPTRSVPTWRGPGAHLEVLDQIELDPGDPLLADGFVYEMLLAHEHQHNETMLQLLQMVESYEPVEVDRSPAAEPVSEGPEMVRVEGGAHEIGAPDGGFAYDNERPRHRVELDPFWIDRIPVTNGDYIRFIEETGGEPPMYWERDGDGWLRTAMGHPSRSIRVCRSSTCPGTRPMPSRAGPASASDRAGVGGGGPGRDRDPRQPRRALLGCAPAGSLRRRPDPTRRRADARGRLGVDEPDFTAYPASPPSLPGVSGVSSAITTRSPRRRLGDPPRRDPDELPQLGPRRAPSDLLRHPLRQRRFEG